MEEMVKVLTKLGLPAEVVKKTRSARKIRSPVAATYSKSGLPSPLMPMVVAGGGVVAERQAVSAVDGGRAEGVVQAPRAGIGEVGILGNGRGAAGLREGTGARGIDADVGEPAEGGDTAGLGEGTGAMGAELE